jgi:D-sedoheptulose 7-phosphate isomerase
MNANVRIPPMALAERVNQFADVMATIQVTAIDGAARDGARAVGEVLGVLKGLRTGGGSLYVIGNGGSAAVASHAVTDFVNVGRLRATTVHEPSIMTCMSNDYGYENAYARILSVMARPTDALIAISSSGRSPNITNAVKAFRAIGGVAITLSGFARDNPLRGLGEFNFWLDASDYGFVEIGHQFILHNLADRLRLDV